MKAKFILLLPFLLACQNEQVEQWPRHTPTDEQRQLGLSNAFQYRKEGLDAKLRSQEYTPDGDYLNYGKTVFHRESTSLKLDAEGVPMVFQAGAFHYSPGTVAIAALAEHGRYKISGDSKKFFSMAEKLLTLMGEDGALRYPYPYRHYTSTQALAVGWTSGMDQGMALSVFSRAYLVSKDRKWIDAGSRALRFLQTPYPHGPSSNLGDLDSSLAQRTFFLEYPTQPHSYTLNGYMFTLLGLYDWAAITKTQQAEQLFIDGVDTLVRVLPYYDIGTFSAYDLSYITHSKLPYLQPRKPHIAPRYHAIHIAQLRALHSVSKREELKSTAERWQRYAEGIVE